MNVNSYWEKNKFNIPIATGLLIWTIVFLIMLFNSNFSSGLLTSTLIFSSLIVGVPTCIFEIVFVYVFKVVKMKPKSSYDIGDINDYILLQERFRSGNYEYKTIKSMKDIMEAYERGKKIVFTARSSSEILNYLFGSIFTIPMIVGAIILFAVSYSLNFPLEVIGYPILLLFLAFVFVSIFILPAIFRSRRLPRSFFILAPEGIVYRSILSGVMSYSWKELDFKVYSVKTTIYGPLFSKMELPGGPQLHIILPNGSRLKFIPSDYNLDEFGSYEKLNGNIISPIVLVIMAFKYYSYATKGGDFKKDQIYNYLVRNSRKSFTSKAIFDRINEIDLSEKMKNDLDMNTIEQILEDLFVNRKIRRKDKEGKQFYFF